ncbi:MAG TPA: hypothetical protein VGR72_07570 [Candidatus Acidoferrales bacterium]|nr:hypothetical protein [Candidatus Acidoferrales bacterium]
MRRWGIVITVFYFLILIVLLVPAACLLAAGEIPSMSDLIKGVGSALAHWLIWIPIVAVVSGQALLLFLSVDTSQQRLKPRTHIRVSIIATAMLLGLLSFAAIFSLAVGIRGDAILNVFPESDAASQAVVLGAWAFLWLIWGIVFQIFYRDSSEWVTRATSWLLKGSVLELLIAIPSHVIARRREHCCAPTITSFGIATGIAIMLLSFGPSVLFLFKKRMDARVPRSRPAS